MKLIKELYKLSSESGILVLENSRNNRVHIIRTSDALGSFSRLLKGTKSRNKRWKLLRKDIKKIDIKLVSDDNSRVSYQYWVSYYESLGYTLYYKYKAIEYKLKIDIEDYVVVVKLVSRNRSQIVIGKFSSMEEAKRFTDIEYPKGLPIRKIILSKSI